MSKEEHFDFYNLDTLYLAGEIAFRNRVRQFVDEECLPAIVDYFDKGTFPLDMIPRMAKMGLFGLHLDGYGCNKVNETTYGLICLELGRCDSGLRAMVSVQNSLVMYPLYAFGSEAQKEKWLPRMAKGEAIGCFALSEPEFGSDPAGMVTHAEKKGSFYRLNGAKMWITNGPIAQIALVWAKADAGIRAFLVEAGTPGFEATLIQRKFSSAHPPRASLFLKTAKFPRKMCSPGPEG